MAFCAVLRIRPIVQRKQLSC